MKVAKCERDKGRGTRVVLCNNHPIHARGHCKVMHDLRLSPLKNAARDSTSSSVVRGGGSFRTAPLEFSGIKGISPELIHCTTRENAPDDVPLKYAASS